MPNSTCQTRRWPHNRADVGKECRRKCAALCSANQVIPERSMLKRVFFVGLLVAGNAVAQDVTVSGKELESGAADAKVAALAQQAAQAGKPVVVNAPSEWHGKIAAKL